MNSLGEPGGEVSAAKKKRVDTDALTGLRGVAAMHVAIGHHFQVRLSAPCACCQHSAAVQATSNLAVPVSSEL